MRCNSGASPAVNGQLAASAPRCASFADFWRSRGRAGTWYYALPPENATAHPLARVDPTLVRQRCARSLDPARQDRLHRFENCTIVLPDTDAGTIQTARQLRGARCRTRSRDCTRLANVCIPSIHSIPRNRQTAPHLPGEIRHQVLIAHPCQRRAQQRPCELRNVHDGVVKLRRPLRSASGTSPDPS